MATPDRTRYRGALLGGLVGDALGAPFEGWPPLVPAPRWATVAAGHSRLAVTDDSEMTLALAESLVRCEGLDDDDLAATFARYWARAPEAGYSGPTADLLARIHRGDPWQTARRGGGRPSNGAAMRVAPVALYAAGRLDVTLTLAERSALVTHPHVGAVAGARVQAAAVATALTHPPGGPLDAEHFVRILRSATDDAELRRRLDLAGELAHHADPRVIGERIGSGLHVHESVPAAICVVLARPGSVAEAIALAVELGGDTDTVAAMAGAISGALLGEATVPVEWIERTGRGTQVQVLADSLHELATRDHGDPVR